MMRRETPFLVLIEAAEVLNCDIQIPFPFIFFFIFFFLFLDWNGWVHKRNSTVPSSSLLYFGKKIKLSHYQRAYFILLELHELSWDHLVLNSPRRGNKIPNSVPDLGTLGIVLLRAFGKK